MFRKTVGVVVIDGIMSDVERSEYTIDYVASDCSASTKYSGIAHLLAEFLALLFQFAIFPVGAGTFARSIGDGQRHVAVFVRRMGVGYRSLLVDHIDVATWENSLEACSFVATSPP